MAKTLADRRILITGAGSGIGRAGALRMADAGARLLLMDRDDSVEDTRELVAANGAEAVALRGDAGAEADVEALVELARVHYGGLDGAWANAGIRGPQEPLTEQRIEDWEETLRVNLLGPFLLIKHVVPMMVEAGGGVLLCTASVAGLRAHAGGTAYSASKAGVISLVQTTAHALAGTGVRINAICPGLIETGMTAPVFERARSRGSEHRIGQLNPTRRAGQPDEIAAVATMLLSDDASYVNGQAIPVDGGLSASHPFVPRRDP